LLRINFDIGCDKDLFPFQHWMRRMAIVPKGFLRYEVLKLLSEKPMSGSELMSEIEKKTNGYWKPSPGSIYPLLAWLQEKRYIKEAPEQEVGIKRYVLTDHGKTFLEEHEKRLEGLQKGYRHFGPGPEFMGPMWSEFYPEKAKELRAATKDLAVAVFKLRNGLKRQYSEEAAKEATEALKQVAMTIERIANRIEGVNTN